MNRMSPILIEISPGELFDKITVLLVKLGRIAEPEKLENIRRELATLRRAEIDSVPASSDLNELVVELKSVNGELYDVISGIYECERTNSFGPAFVEMARSVYRLNDKRA